MYRSANFASYSPDAHSWIMYVVVSHEIYFPLLSPEPQDVG